MGRPEYWKTRLDEVKAVMDTVKKGTVKVVAKSAGNRDVYLVEYGEKQDFHSTANYSSSCGAGSTKYFADKAGKKPVVFIVGAEHGSEMEGIVAILNLIQMIETGKDFNGYTNPYLMDCIKDCRLLLIPVANPDGRSRMVFDTLHDVPYYDFRHYAQGTWKDGTLCMYPQCKTIHPIKDACDYLGAYFNDDGINIMHDNFFGKMANETQAIFDTAFAEAPDFTLHLHGGANIKNEIANPNYVAPFTRRITQTLKERVTAAADLLNLPTLLNEITEDDYNPPKTFNLTSALHHACGTVSVLYESNEGLDYSAYRPLDPWETFLSYEDILMEHYILFEQTIRLAHDCKRDGNL